MKFKKFLSTICAMAISASTLASVSFAATTETYETIFEDDFTSGVTSVTDEATVTGAQVSADNGTAKFSSSFETFHISFDDNKSYSVSESHKLKMTFDVKVSGVNRFGIGFGDTARDNGAFWGFSLIRSDASVTSADSSNGNLAMGSAWEDVTKMYALKDEQGNRKASAADTWYTVETYLELPSKIMTTKAWLKDDPSVVYSNSITAPEWGSCQVGGSKATSINAVRIFSLGDSYIDNLKVEHLVSSVEDDEDDGTLFYADFDTKGTAPAVQANASASASILTDDNSNKYLNINATWSRYFHTFNDSKTVSATTATNLETSFDIQFPGNNMVGVALGDTAESKGSYWLISYNGKGVVIGSNETNEGTKIAYLQDASGNKPTIDTSKWYRVESKLEFPSKTITTTLYERDTENATKYTASHEAWDTGNYIVGGKPDTVAGIRYMAVCGMNIDNIQVKQTEPDFEIKSAAFNGTDVEVTFSLAADTVAATTIGGKTVTGTLSSDGMTYTIPVSDFETGTYDLVIAEGTTSVSGQTIEESATFSVDIKDKYTLGYHPFTGGSDNGSALSLGGIGSAWASLKQDTDGNWYMSASKGTAAVNGDVGEFRYWQYMNTVNDGIGDYWNSEATSKLMAIEFDIRIPSAMTNVDRIYFSKEHKYQSGLQIFGMNADTVAMGEPESARAFKEITSLTPNKWYHYKYILDINNKKAKAILSDGENEYKVDWKDLAGTGQGYWLDSIETPFNTMAFQLPGGEINLDNITISKYYEAPTVNADSIVLKNDDVVQSDWSKISTSTNKIEIDFATTMDETSVNDDSVYLTKKGDSNKIEATGAFLNGKYVLTVTGEIEASTEYELHITTAVKNVKQETFGTEDYVASFKTADGELKVALKNVKSEDGNTEITTLDALKALAGQKVKINVDYANTLKETAGEYNVIVAHYNGDALVSAEIINVTHDANVSKLNEDVTHTLPTDMSSITNTSIFCWSELDTMQPLCASINY